MEKERPKYEVRHGGLELDLPEAEIQALFLSYKEQFAPQQGEGGTGLTDEQILGYLHYVLAQPETVVLFSDGGQVMGMGGIDTLSQTLRTQTMPLLSLGLFVLHMLFVGRVYLKKFCEL